MSHPDNIRLADTPQTFANECLTLLSDRVQREAVAAAALHLVTSRYSWDAITDEFERLLVVK